MRIVLTHFGARGIASYCLNLYNYLKAQGHEVLLVSLSKWKKEKIASMVEAKSLMLFGLVPIVFKSDELAKKIEEFKPDLIHHHLPSSSIDIFFKNIGKIKIPKLITIHVPVNSRNYFMDKCWYYGFSLCKRNLREFDKMISVSRYVQSQIKDRVECPESKYSLIYAGVDENIFKPVERKKNAELNILFVGQIMPEKGISSLIKSVIEVRKKKAITLTVIGEGHLKSYLQRITKKHPYIKWTDFIKDQAEIAKYYANADLTALPSKWEDAFPMVLVESMACGTPVMATKKGGIPEIVVPGKTGYLIDSCSEKEIMNALMQIDKSGLELMREGCRKLIIEKYTLQLMGENHEKVYRDMISK